MTLSARPGGAGPARLCPALRPEVSFGRGACGRVRCQPQRDLEEHGRPARARRDRARGGAPRLSAAACHAAAGCAAHPQGAAAKAIAARLRRGVSALVDRIDQCRSAEPWRAASRPLRFPDRRVPECRPRPARAQLVRAARRGDLPVGELELPESAGHRRRPESGDGRLRAAGTAERRCGRRGTQMAERPGGPARPSSAGFWRNCAPRRPGRPSS